MVKSGATTVQPDLYGSGDSAGVLNQATWGLWQTDLRTVIQHIVETTHTDNHSNSVEISLIGIRAGCLMLQDAISLIEQTKTLILRNLIMVQPEHRGEDVINRLFRSRIVAQRLAGNKSQTSQSLWELIDSGATVEAAGHSLSAPLCQSICGRNLDGVVATTEGKHRTWLEISNILSKNDDLSELAVSWDVESHSHAPFWQSYDIEPENSLIEAVVRAVTR